MIGAAGDVERGPEESRNADKARLDESRVCAHPQSAVPGADGRQLPAADQVVQRCGDIAGEMFALPEGEIIDRVERHAVDRDGGVVEVSEPQPLLVAEVWLTQQIDILGYGRPTTSAQTAVSPAAVDRRVSSSESPGVCGGQGAHVRVKPLEAYTVGKLPAEFDLRRMVARIAGMVDADQAPPRYRPQQSGLRRWLKPGAQRVAVFRLLVVGGELLLQVSTIRPDVAQP